MKTVVLLYVNGEKNPVVCTNREAMFKYLNTYAINRWHDDLGMVATNPVLNVTCYFAHTPGEFYETSTVGLME